MQTLLLAALLGLAVTCSAQNTSAPAKHTGIAHEAEAATFTFHTSKERTNLTASAPLVTAVSVDSDEARAMAARVRAPAPAPAPATAMLMAAQSSGAADAPAPAQLAPLDGQAAGAPSQQQSEGLSGALDPARPRSTINGDAATSQHGPATAAAAGGQSPATRTAADEFPGIHPTTPISNVQHNSPPVSDVTTVSDTQAPPVAGAAVSTSHAPAIAVSILVIVALVAGIAGAVIWRQRRARRYSNLRDTEMALRAPHEM